MGDKVYLLTKNLKIWRPTKKLNHVKVRPFFINKIYYTNDGHQSINYKLQLLTDARIHLIFYISLLKLADPSIPLQDTFHYEIKEENEFEVEAILAQKGQQYLIKWKEYPETENTWEPVTNL